MAIKPDQRAMLQLLLERGQGYEDIGGLLGVDSGEVRARARAVLTELGGADPDAEVGLSDFLLGQADPIGRADAVRHLQKDSETLELAKRISEQLRLLAPGAELPKLPEPRGKARPRAAQPPPDEPVAAADDRRGGGGPLPTLSRRQAQMLAGLGAGALILFVAILAIAGVFSGGDDGTEAAQNGGAADGEILTTVPLRPRGGAEGRGRTLFGLASGDQPYVDLELSGLEPAPEDQSYVLWLLLDEETGHPLAPVQVAENGSFDDRFPIANFVVQVAARTQIVDVSLTDSRKLLTELRAALQDRTPVIDYTGKSVLRGRIPTADQVGPEGLGGGAGGGGGGNRDGDGG